MLSEKEEAFLAYWEQNRIPFSSTPSKLVRGMPMAMMFGLPILLSVLVVYLFFPDWYTKISATTSGTFGVVVIAVFIAILFFSYFRMHFKWEMNEQAYLELKHKKQGAANS
ncbi:MAG: hypothetical protein JWQ27_643 [Ferruginibacter sp.]|nr:hypothetical protein [Ferruginibacter sp.]